MRGGARRQPARRTQDGRAAAGGEASGYGNPGERERATLSLLPRAPYLRRWAFFSSLLRQRLNPPKRAPPQPPLPPPRSQPPLLRSQPLPASQPPLRPQPLLRSQPPPPSHELPPDDTLRSKPPPQLPEPHDDPAGRLTGPSGLGLGLDAPALDRPLHIVPAATAVVLPPTARVPVHIAIVGSRSSRRRPSRPTALWPSGPGHPPSRWRCSAGPCTVADVA